jgi:serine/threonine protein kinase
MSHYPGLLIAKTYEVKRVLGDGASGVVSLGVDQRNNQIVAIKTPKMGDTIFGRAFEHSGCIKTAARIYREVRILKSLEHPNIITLKDLVCPSVTESRQLIAE